MKIIHIENKEDKHVIHRENDLGEKDCIVCLEIRGAIVAPDRLNNTDGYYLLFGKEKEVESPDMPPLVFLAEMEVGSLKDLFTKLVADEKNFLFHTLYTEPVSTGDGINPSDFFISLKESITKNLPWIRIVPAFHAADTGQGVDFLYQWAGRSNLPEGTVLRNQLGDFRRDNFDSPFFHAITALQYLLAGFKKDRDPPIGGVRQKRTEAKRIAAQKCLTGASRAASKEIEYLREEAERRYERKNDIW